MLFSVLIVCQCVMLQDILYTHQGNATTCEHAGQTSVIPQTNMNVLHKYYCHLT